MLDADVIVDLAKLKSHALTKFSGAVKNYYGTIPGLQKVETHARFPDYGDFGSMLCDLCAYFAGNKPTFSVLDGIVAMEGNGPTGGEPEGAWRPDIRNKPVLGRYGRGAYRGYRRSHNA